MKKKKITNCETCAYFEYDEDYDCNICTINLDEDEMEKYLTYTNFSCPYYKYYDEYSMVRRQN